MNDRVLVLSPHTDDGELGCGGTISKFIEMGKEVKLVAFSTAEKSLPDGFEADSTKKEMFRACNILGLNNDDITVLDFEVRIFSKFRQEILDSLIKIRNDFNPHVVMIPSQKDTHQDHEVITREALRAFKKTSFSIYGYEQPWNCFTFDTIGFVPLDENHIQKKIEAVQQYKSQSVKEYMMPDFIRGLARTRAINIGQQYAEAFEVIRQVII